MSTFRDALAEAIYGMDTVRPGERREALRADAVLASPEMQAIRSTLRYVFKHQDRQIMSIYGLPSCVIDWIMEEEK